MMSDASCPLVSSTGKGFEGDVLLASVDEPVDVCYPMSEPSILVKRYRHTIFATATQIIHATELRVATIERPEGFLIVHVVFVCE